MKYVLLYTSLFLLFGYSFPRSILGLKILRDIEFIKSYLDKYYPLPFLREQIKAMQQFLHRPITGIMDKSLIETMLLPRCGLPDVQQQRAQPIWTKKDLTYWILNYTQDLSKSKVEECISKGFQVWSNVTPLKFHKDYKEPDMEISFAEGDHGDGHPFDGPGGTLAHAYFPPHGGCHYDDGEKWTVRRKGKGVKICSVAMHETGHLLGLSHSDVEGAMMYPTYSGNMHLSDVDIQNIQELYGKP